jgi:outer membrane receptor protein involved in Fe transport
VGFFYKDLSQPIERVALSFSTIDVDSFKNAGGATLWGFEFEFRRNLGAAVDYLPEGHWRDRLATQLPYFNFFTNVAFTTSEVDVGERLSEDVCRDIPEPKPIDCSQVVTNQTRALQGQAPFVVNAGIEYDNPEVVNARILYNTIGNRINAVGLNGLPDIFDERRDQLDLVASKKIELFDVPLNVKASIQNLLNDRFLQTQEGRDTIRFREGLTFGLSVSYSF